MVEVFGMDLVCFMCSTFLWVLSTVKCTQKGKPDKFFESSPNSTPDRYQRYQSKQIPNDTDTPEISKLKGTPDESQRAYKREHRPNTTVTQNTQKLLCAF